MDTKLKNRHRVGIVLAVLVVLTAAVTMVGLYPYFEKESEAYESDAYEDETFLQALIFGNYVLNVEQAERGTGTTIAPFKFYFPGISADAPATEDASAVSGMEEIGVQESITVQWSDENKRSDYMSALERYCNAEFDMWSRSFGGIRNLLEYQVIAKDGTILLNHSKQKDLQTEGKYAFKTVLHYDDQGKMEVVLVEGNNSHRLREMLESIGEDDPMESYYDDYFNSDWDLMFSGPRDMTFVYAMTGDTLNQYMASHPNYWYSYYSSGTVSRIFTSLSAAVIVLAFLFSFFNLTRAEHSKLLRTPFEIVAITGLCGTAFGYSLINLVAITNQGRLYGGLIRANFLPWAAEIMVFFWNIMWWSVPFAILYWAVLCVKEIFSIGIGRYIRERTLVGMMWSWLKRIIGRIYSFINKIDLQDKSNRTIWKIVIINFVVLAVICSMWFFGIGALIIYSLLLFLVLNRYYTDLRVKYGILLKATGQIAEGNLDVDITDDLGVFEPFREEIQKIQRGFKVAVEEEVKSQNMKTDLITNVSHDLKTPLTAIITYVNLLKDDSITQEQRHAYIDVLEQKSMRLKTLIEDLFEISKATSKNVTLNLVEMDIVSLLKEVSFELSDKIEESTIDFRWNLPDEKIILTLDSQKTYRIFENLLINIIKYAMPHTRAYIGLKKEDECVTISMKNVSATELDYINPDDITERFVRGDQSRNTEGTGLGLAIAKSFVELQHGKMTVEVEADLFRVTIRWPH